MANPTFNIGFKPVHTRDSGFDAGNCHHYLVPSAYATAVYLYDAVVRVSGSNTAIVSTATGVHPIGSLPQVNLAVLGTGSNPITGSIVGFEQIRSNLNVLHGAASLDRVVRVVDSRDQVYQVRDDGAVALTASAVNKNAVLIAGTANTDNSCTGVRMDSGTTTAPAAANPTYQLKIVGLSKIANNVVGKNAVWDVIINNHSDAPGTGSAGV